MKNWDEWRMTNLNALHLPSNLSLKRHSSFGSCALSFQEKFAQFAQIVIDDYSKVSNLIRSADVRL